MMNPLPQVNPQGGPNPNSGVNMDMSTMPAFAMAGQTFAAQAALARAYAPPPVLPPSPPVVAPPPPPPQSIYGNVPAAATGLPGMSGNYTRMGANGRAVSPVADLPPMADGTVSAPELSTVNPTDPSRSAFSNWFLPAPSPAGAAFTAADQAARALEPNLGQKLHSFLFDPVGGAQAGYVNNQAGAADAIRSPGGQALLGSHPSMLAHAQADPVGFAKHIGPILEAKKAIQDGTTQPGTQTIPSADGPVTVHDPHMPLTQGIVDAYGVPHSKAWAIANPGALSTEEFTNVMRGTPRNVFKSMMEMHHYLDPSNQAQAALLSNAQQAYDANPTQAAADALNRVLSIIGSPSTAYMTAAPVKK